MQSSVTGLTYIFMIISLQWKLMKIDTATEVLATNKKSKNQQNKNLIVSLLELMKRDLDIFRTINEIFRHIK